MKKLKLVIGVGFLCLLSSRASAHKNVGGGNGVGGVLLDRAAYADAQQLDGQGLFDMVARQESDLITTYPLLGALLHDVLMQDKSWYLDTHTFVPDCVNQTLVTLPQTVVACQNDVETRVHDDWWTSANETTRSELLLHEAITSMWLYNDKAKSIGGVVASLILRKDSISQTQLKFAQADLPVFPSATEMNSARQHLHVFAQALCQIHSRDGAFNWLENYRNTVSTMSRNVVILFVNAANDLLNNCRLGSNYCVDNQDDSLLDAAMWDGFKGYYSDSFDPPSNWSRPICQ